MSMKTLGQPLAKMIAQGLWQTDRCTSIFLESGKLDLNHFCPQNPGSAKIEETVTQNNVDENDIAFNQHNLHLTRKRTQTKKLGQVNELPDGLCTVINVSILLTIVEVKTDKNQSIFYQIISRFTRFYSSHMLTTWATKYTLKQP